MALTQIARPYARAAFEHARVSNSLGEWSGQLELLAGLVGDERVARLITDPRLPRVRRGEFLLEVSGDRLRGPARNLVHLLAENGRLGAMGEVAREFERLRAVAENRIDAQLICASELDADQQKRLTAALSRRLNKDVRLHPRVDQELIGGVIVRAGDLVIDASLRGRLQRLATRLGH